MGLFDRFKKKEIVPLSPATKPKPSSGANLVEIARLISSGDEAVLRDISTCVNGPQSWFEAHQDQYEERGVDSADDLELIQWLGLVDILEEHNYVCERDWKDELEDFLFFLQNLKGYRTLQLSLDPAWFHPEGDIPLWCGILAEKWGPKGVRVAAIDIDSDSYVLFPASVSQFSALQGLAEEINRHIEFVEKM